MTSETRPARLSGQHPQSSSRAPAILPISVPPRAMKTMGLHKLTIVAPNLMATPMTENPPAFDPEHPHRLNYHKESFVPRFRRGRQVLENATIAASLDEAACLHHHRLRPDQPPLRNHRAAANPCATWCPNYGMPTAARKWRWFRQRNFRLKHRRGVKPATD